MADDEVSPANWWCYTVLQCLQDCVEGWNVLYRYDLCDMEWCAIFYWVRWVQLFLPFFLLSKTWFINHMVNSYKDICYCIDNIVKYDIEEVFKNKSVLSFKLLVFNWEFYSFQSVLDVSSLYHFRLMSNIYFLCLVQTIQLTKGKVW